jgi:hypothetical protein
VVHALSGALEFVFCADARADGSFSAEQAPAIDFQILRRRAALSPTETKLLRLVIGILQMVDDR